MKNFQDILNEFNACSEAREWASDKTIEQVVAECHRGDWLLWLADRLNVDNRQLTLAKAHCANTVRRLMKDERGTKAIDVAIAYGEKKATIAQLEEAFYAAYNAAYDARHDRYASVAYDAAASAAYASASVAYDAYAAAAYAAAASAAYAAHDAADAADARAENRMLTAYICRKYIGQEIIELVNKQLSK